MTATRQDQDDRAEALSRYPVSRETEQRLDGLVSELKRWQQAKNLVAPSTMTAIWSRHVLDSLQLIDHAPANSLRWLDIGSGGGFPGLVLGALLAERPGATIDLVEANGRKCAFLTHVARLMKAPVRVHAMRIEDFMDRADLPAYDVVTARALAGLPELIGWCGKLLTRGSICLFPKGQDVASELTGAAKSPTVQLAFLPSLTDANARIVRVSQAPGGLGGADPHITEPQ